MISPKRQSITTPCLLLLLLGLLLAPSCGGTKTDSNTSPKPEAKTDPKADFIRSLKGANVDGFNFEISEDANQVVTSLTNGAAKDVITMGKADSTVVVRYAGIQDKKTNSTKTYKTEAVKAGSELSIVVTDIATNAVLSKDNFPVQDLPTGPCDGPKFASLQACIKDFNCKRGSELLCEANRTCKDQFAALICALNNGQCFSVHLVIRPTDLRCIILGTLPDRLELALER
jgi:hypothetical protein